MRHLLPYGCFGPMTASSCDSFDLTFYSEKCWLRHFDILCYTQSVNCFRESDRFSARYMGKCPPITFWMVVTIRRCDQSRPNARNTLLGFRSDVVCCGWSRLETLRVLKVHIEDSNFKVQRCIVKQQFVSTRQELNSLPFICRENTSTRGWWDLASHSKA